MYSPVDWRVAVGAQAVMAITTRVKAALVKEPGIKSNAIEVETYRGVVSLSGFVDSPEMASKALSTAKSVGGVRSVKNDVRVKPSY